MVLTRATDTRLKTLFTGGEVRYGESAFQGKGFRSLGQEAIYAAGIRLRRGDAFRDGGEWRGDVIAPIIRDLGAALAMRPTAETVRMVLSAQMAKAGPPMHGKDLHVGDLACGILPAAAPLAIGSLTIAGMALAFARDGSGRVALSFIGEGRLVARRVARGDQPVRGTQAPGRVRGREQSDGPLDSRARSVRRACVRGQGVRVRHSWHHDRRHRPGRDRRRVCLGRRTCARGARPDSHRARLDAHVRPRTPRRHAVPRQGAAAGLGVSAAPPGGLRRSGFVCVLVGARSHHDVRGAAAARRAHRRG